MHILISFIVNAIALYLIANFVPGFNHGVGVGTALIAAVVFGIVNAVLGPILRLITIPINWITHGLFSIVINYILFWLTVVVAPNFSTNGEVSPWLAYLIGAVIMMLVSTALQERWRSRTERSNRRSS
jgi:putative membrane protein